MLTICSLACHGAGRQDGQSICNVRRLSHVAGRKGAVETGGGFGEFGRRQFEAAGGGADELGGDVASAAGADGTSATAE